MNKLLLVVICLLPFTAKAESYFECETPADPLITKACSSAGTIEKARQFNAFYQQIFAQSKSYEAIKPAVKIKNDYRNEVSRCRAVKDIYPICIDTALDKATAELSRAYIFDSDPLTLEANALKESAYKNASLLKDEARKVPALCLKNEAKHADDNISPASDVAVGVAAACKSKAVEFVTFANDTLILWDVLNLIPRMNSDQINDLSERSFGVDAASKAVLEGRVEKYKAEIKNKPKAKKKKRKASSS